MTLVTDFYFDLPQELIAQHPPAERGASRMLVLSREQGIGNREQRAGSAAFVDARFRDLPEFLRRGDLLVLNDSRVLPARLYATRAGLAMQANSRSCWWRRWRSWREAGNREQSFQRARTTRRGPR
jgi:S-adenosylmethionine:tRNA ribosyltransferase-isomerase